MFYSIQYTVGYPFYLLFTLLLFQACRIVICRNMTLILEFLAVMVSTLRWQEFIS